jgi:hypothetical protein
MPGTCFTITSVISQEMGGGTHEIKVVISWSLLKLGAEHKGVHYPLLPCVYFDNFHNKKHFGSIPKRRKKL